MKQSIVIFVHAIKIASNYLTQTKFTRLMDFVAFSCSAVRLVWFLNVIGLCVLASDVSNPVEYRAVGIFVWYADGIAGRRLSSASLNSDACSSVLSHGTCASMTTQVGSAVARYGAYSRLGAMDQSSLGRSAAAAWDSLGRHSTVSGNYSPTYVAAGCLYTKILWTLAFRS